MIHESRFMSDEEYLSSRRDRADRAVQQAQSRQERANYNVKKAEQALRFALDEQFAANAAYDRFGAA